MRGATCTPALVRISACSTTIEMVSALPLSRAPAERRQARRFETGTDIGQLRYRDDGF